MSKDGLRSPLKRQLKQLGLVLGQLSMEKNIVLRKAVIGDIEQIKRILFSSLKEYEIAIPDNYSVSDIDSIYAKNKIEQVFVAVRGDSVIGFVVLKPITEESIELKRLYLTSTQRGQGLGKDLLNYTINYANENNYKYIRLETTSKFKEAVSLYKKHGFLELKDVEKSPGHDLALEKNLNYTVANYQQDTARSF